jgi:hypothetical protein
MSSDPKSTRPASKTSPARKGSQKTLSPGQWAPHIDDPDPPEIMSPAESKEAARKLHEFLKNRRGK